MRRAAEATGALSGAPSSIQTLSSGCREPTLCLPHTLPSQVAESHPERIAAPGDDPNLDLTFKPRLSAYKMEGERTTFFKK